MLNLGPGLMRKKRREQRMTMENEVQFYKWDPSAETEGKARRVFDGLLDKAPADATIQAVLFRSTVGFACRVRIASHEAQFNAESTGINPDQALKRTEEKICKQLDLWKKNRFLKKVVVAEEAS